MTEREKLVSLFELFGVEVMEAKSSITAAGRRYFFTADGTLAKIIFGSGKDRRVVRAGDAERERDAG
jgi:hypothetical protein